MTRRNDRLLAVADHAVDRFHERVSASLSTEEIRRLITAAVLAGPEERHNESQTRVRIVYLGVEAWAVIGADTTGWSTTGRAVVTVLTTEQIGMAA